MAYHGLLAMVMNYPWHNQLKNIPTPAYLIDQKKLNNNLEIFKSLKSQTNCKIILALKGYATFSTFPSIQTILDGVTASSIYEARLGVDEFKKDVHAYGVAFNESEVVQMNQLCSHISLNSMNQLNLFRKANPTSACQIGLRLNPQISVVDTPIYDPCSTYSRLGIPLDSFDPMILNKIDGLHIHALCEQNTEALSKVLNHVESELGNHLSRLKWMNWGGGHHITRDDYNLNHLISLINDWKHRYGIDIILEPGEAVGLNCGYYVAKILDITKNDKQIAICDISATAHMPDVLEYPYRPSIQSSVDTKDNSFTYIIAGNTCLAGDIIGEYSFKEPLNVNDSIIFNDMGHYTLVKTSNFNGVKQPSIGIIGLSNKIQMIKSSSFYSYRERLS